MLLKALVYFNYLSIIYTDDWSIFVSAGLCTLHGCSVYKNIEASLVKTISLLNKQWPSGAAYIYSRLVISRQNLTNRLKYRGCLTEPRQRRLCIVKFIIVAKQILHSILELAPLCPCMYLLGLLSQLPLS